MPEPSTFHGPRSAASAGLLDGVATVGLGIAVLGIALLIVRHAILGEAPVAWAPQSAAVLFMVWARVVLGRRSFRHRASPSPGELVTTGPYGIVRHPIYAAVLWFTTVSLLSHRSWETLGAWTLVATGLGVRVACEERALTTQLPADADYASRTKRLIPFLL
jgi:protein-S-isoprenylcysteine O-methyltransferase Ste14